MIAEPNRCTHPPPDTLQDVLCTSCGVLKIDGVERCGEVDGFFVCLASKGHTGPHRGVDTRNRRAVELRLLSREW